MKQQVPFPLPRPTAWTAGFENETTTFFVTSNGLKPGKAMRGLQSMKSDAFYCGDISLSHRATSQCHSFDRTGIMQGLIGILSALRGMKNGV